MRDFLFVVVFFDVEIKKKKEKKEGGGAQKLAYRGKQTDKPEFSLFWKRCSTEEKNPWENLRCRLGFLGGEVARVIHVSTRNDKGGDLCVMLLSSPKKIRQKEGFFRFVPRTSLRWRMGKNFYCWLLKEQKNDVAKLERLARH